MDFANAQSNLDVIDEVHRMRREAGRDHLPFELSISLTDPKNVDSIRRAEDKGVDAVMLLPAAFTLNKRLGQSYSQGLRDRVIGAWMAGPLPGRWRRPSG